jgi:hypothetical protein
MTVFPLNTEQDTTISGVSGTKFIPGTRKDYALQQKAVQHTPDSLSADTATVCMRNSIADITYYNPSNTALKIKIPGSNTSILFLAEKTQARARHQKEILLKSLKDGNERTGQVFHKDWTLLVITVSFLLFTLVKTTTRNLKYSDNIFTLKGSADPSAHDTGLFHWQSTVMNLTSFFIFALFCYNAASISGLIPSGFSGIAVWGISLGALVLAFTVRHVICLATGRMSDQTEAFNEYLAGIYQAYHISAIVLFFLVIMVSYTVLLPDKVFLIAGLAVIGIMYLSRVIRLLIIFLNRNISIFYLILYLCALEFLPVAVAIRYFTGLV